MSYASATDFLALLRTASDGARLVSVPGLDWVVAAMARAGLVTLWVSPSAGPNTNQATTVWLKVSSTSWATEGTVYLYDPSVNLWEPATPSLWALLFRRIADTASADSTDTAPTVGSTLTLADSGKVFTNGVASILQFVLPAAENVPGAEYAFAQVQAGQINVLVDQSGTPRADTLQWGGTATNIGALANLTGSYMKIRSTNGFWLVTSGEGTWVLS